jgi:hypothetical protein
MANEIPLGCRKKRPMVLEDLYTMSGEKTELHTKVMEKLRSKFEEPKMSTWNTTDEIFPLRTQFRYILLCNCVI